jgi:hypothetical protein
MVGKCDCNFRRLRYRQEIYEAAGAAFHEADDRCEATTQLDDYWRRRARVDAARVAHALLDPAWSRAALACNAAVIEAAQGIATVAHWPVELPSQREAVASARTAQIRTNINLLRDIFGNPFRPVTFDPSWRTDTVLSLARGMYESRDFSPIPILADALRDAGCDNEAILAHCRGDGPHVRGCWVVDLVLGKE